MSDVGRAKEKVARRYDAWSRWYDRIDTSRLFGGKSQERWRRRAIEMLDARPDDVVVDLGTGSGLILPWILERYPEVRLLGVDLSSKMLEVAKGRVRDVGSLFMGDIDKLPFRDGSVDRLIATYTFTTAPEPRAMLLEAARVLKKGGTFVILDTGPPPGQEGRILHAWMRLSARLFGYTHIERRLHEHLPYGKFKNIAEERFYRGTVYIIKLLRT